MNATDLSTDAGPVDVPLLNETIPANLARIADTFAEREALVSCHQDIRWTYRVFHERVRRLARLEDSGLPVGTED